MVLAKLSHSDRRFMESLGLLDLEVLWAYMGICDRRLYGTMREFYSEAISCYVGSRGFVSSNRKYNEGYSESLVQSNGHYFRLL